MTALFAAAIAVLALQAAPPATARYDARDPASLTALLATMDAKAETVGRDGETVRMKVTTPAFAFGAQFVGCDAQGRACKAMAFTTQSGSFNPSLAHLNAFNQTSLTCRVWQDREGRPNLMYSTLVSAADTEGEGRTHVAAWQGCLASFGEFLKDPTAYLASAP